MRWPDTKKGRAESARPDNESRLLQRQTELAASLDGPAPGAACARGLLCRAALCGVLLVASPASAQELQRTAISAGGGTASGGRFEAVATIGQPTASRSTGDGLELHAGFLFPRPGAAGSLIFRDEFEALPAPSRAAKPVDLSMFSTENPDDR